MKDLKIDLKNTKIEEEEILKYSKKVADIHKELYKKADNEKEFLGWLKLPTDYDKKEFKRIEKVAKKVQRDSDIFLVIGIGGSYLGARAVIEAMNSNFANAIPEEELKYPKVIFVGNNLNPDYINDIIEFIGDKDLSINVISKSGTTTEPAIAFRIFREFLENKYGIDEARSRIYVTTDKKKGALKQLADKEGYEEFVIPDNVGGRYSVLTAVGLLPIAVAGIDINKLMQGALSAQNKYAEENLKYNDCYKYAVARNILYENKKDIELLVDYEPKLHYFIEWWKQLYGESEGKELKGIFPAGVEFTTDLHSMGQFIQDGSRIMFETVMEVEEPTEQITIGEEPVDLDGLNYLAGKTMDFVNKSAMNGTILAHTDGQVPNLKVTIPAQDEKSLGQLFYMYEFACGVSGYILGVNPFNQPGVESYKKNMFALLGKPGYEKEREELLKRL